MGIKEKIDTKKNIKTQKDVVGKKSFLCCPNCKKN